MSRFFVVQLVLLLTATAGCSKGFEKEVAPVTGTVTCDGEPVTDGLVIFTPRVIPGEDVKNTGKTATGLIKSDGSYVLTTYDTDDGAIIGDHDVRIYKPTPEDDESPEAWDYDEDPNLCGRGILRVTVEDADNVIDLDPAKG